MLENPEVYALIIRQMNPACNTFLSLHFGGDVSDIFGDIPTPHARGEVGI